MIKNIVFDIGKVLLDYDWGRYYAEKGYPAEYYDRMARAIWNSEDWIEYDRGVLSDKEIEDLFAANDPEMEELIRTISSEYVGLCRQYEYSVPWLNELRERGYKLYFLTNFSVKLWLDAGEEMDFVKHMDGGLISCFYKVVKPDPAIYQLLLKKYDLKAEECVFFDDRPENVEGAIREGFHGILFEERETAVAQLEELLQHSGNE